MNHSDVPVMHRVSQRVASSPIEDLEGALGAGLDAAAPLSGRRVAVAVGSRGFDRAAELVRLTVARLRAGGLDPFIVPAMGSHGGGTPEGRLAVLERLGITPQAVGAPFEPSGETVELGCAGGAGAFISREALESDGIVLVNRVAQHTGYSGRIQSGTLKMLVVGLGQTEGAASLHAHGFGAGHLIGELADLVLASCPPVIAVAVVEDGTGRLSALEVIPGPRLREREPELLTLAASMKPGIPVEAADILIVDEMGKDISGVGMDPHVTGRGKDFAPGEAPGFSARRLVALRLTPASGGNATGIGHADVTTRALAEAIDSEATGRNVETSGAWERAVLPRVAQTDCEAIIMALVDLAPLSAANARVVRITNTRALSEFEVSSPLAVELAGHSGVMVEPEGRPLPFDGHGGLGR